MTPSSREGRANGNLHTPPPLTTTGVAADVLRGAMKIGAELGEPPGRVYKLWAEGRLQGVWKDGRDLFASKRALRRAHHNRARTGK